MSSAEFYKTLVERESSKGAAKAAITRKLRKELTKDQASSLFCSLSATEEAKIQVMLSEVWP